MIVEAHGEAFCMVDELPDADKDAEKPLRGPNVWPPAGKLIRITFIYLFDEFFNINWLEWLNSWQLISWESFPPNIKYLFYAFHADALPEWKETILKYQEEVL